MEILSRVQIFIYIFQIFIQIFFLDFYLDLFLDLYLENFVVLYFLHFIMCRIIPLRLSFECDLQLGISTCSRSTSPRTVFSACTRSPCTVDTISHSSLCARLRSSASAAFTAQLRVLHRPRFSTFESPRADRRRAAPALGVEMFSRKKCSRTSFWSISSFSIVQKAEFSLKIFRKKLIKSLDKNL